MLELLGVFLLIISGPLMLKLMVWLFELWDMLDDWVYPEAREG